MSDDSSTIPVREKKKSKRKSSSKKAHPEEIQIHVASNDDEGPIVCAFPGGLPAALQTESANPPKFLWRKLPNDKEGRTLIGKDASCLYTSQAASKEVEQRRTKLCVGVYDKQTKAVTLYPAASNGHVFALSQSVPSYDQKAASINNNLTGAAHRRALFEDFGSAKKRKVLKSQEANRVDVDAVVGAGSLMVNSFLKGEAMSESNRRAVEERKHVNEGDNNNEQSTTANQTAIDAATQEWRSKFLPKFNEKAQEPHLVYDAKQMVGDEAWGHVSRVVDACLRQDDPANALLKGPTRNDTPDNEKPNQRSDWNSSVENLVNHISTDGPWARPQFKCAVLLNHFMNLYSKLQRKRFIHPPSDDRPRFYGVPNSVGRSFLENFATHIAGNDDNGEEMGYVMSKANKDKCCLHMLLLFIMSEGGKSMKTSNLKLLADDLKMDVKDASHLLRLAGCTVQRKSGSNKIVAFLKTPLEFPAMKRGGGPKRR